MHSIITIILDGWNNYNEKRILHQTSYITHCSMKHATHAHEQNRVNGMQNAVVRSRIVMRNVRVCGLGKAHNSTQ